MAEAKSSTGRTLLLEFASRAQRNPTDARARKEALRTALRLCGHLIPRRLLQECIALGTGPLRHGSQPRPHERAGSPPADEPQSPPCASDPGAGSASGTASQAPPASSGPGPAVPGHGPPAGAGAGTEAASGGGMSSGHAAHAALLRTDSITSRDSSRLRAATLPHGGPFASSFTSNTSSVPHAPFAPQPSAQAPTPTAGGGVGSGSGAFTSGSGAGSPVCASAARLVHMAPLSGASPMAAGAAVADPGGLRFVPGACSFPPPPFASAAQPGMPSRTHSFVNPAVCVAPQRCSGAPIWVGGCGGGAAHAMHAMHAVPRGPMRYGSGPIFMATDATPLGLESLLEIPELSACVEGLIR
ncbi:hypothetical protein HYH03_015010 [Edaphochlamys debaryana]|uniref:Uncharacterized protein n=1 Tax=Edaphochlamys debaryana TaxID=47281 RepID=A0A835XQA5_9CHLO|nr:hypothetical protein HYH03_015010 [Edaphochlamys debaryana]|eukprot:KAG2486306.1 hypothetical protein HYH03_015010 [Edaphochlamys debaryana]